MGAQWYTVEDSAKTDANGNQGELFRQLLTISLSTTLVAPTLRQQVFIHELVEAMNLEYDLKLRHHTIEQLECALYQVIIDNPSMFSEAPNG